MRNWVLNTRWKTHAKPHNNSCALPFVQTHEQHNLVLSSYAICCFTLYCENDVALISAITVLFDHVVTGYLA